MKKFITTSLACLCLLSIGGRGPINITGTGGAVVAGGATFVALDDANCIGAWLVFSNDAQSAAEADACTGGSAHTMAYSGTFALASDEPTGTPSSQDAVSFDGSDEVFDLSDNSAFEASVFTAGCWIKHTASNGTESFFSHDPNGEWNMKDSSGASGVNLTVATAYTEKTALDTDDNWIQIVMRRGATTDMTEAFFNGAVDCDGSCDTSGSAKPGTTEPIRIGGDSGGNQDWTGALMECVYLDRALTDTEIATWFLCGADGLADGNARDELTNAPTCVEGTHGCCS